MANWGAAKTEPPTEKNVDWSSPRMRPQPVHGQTSCGTVHRGVNVRAAGESETKGTGTRLRYLWLLGGAATCLAIPPPEARRRI